MSYPAGAEGLGKYGYHFLSKLNFFDIQFWQLLKKKREFYKQIDLWYCFFNFQSYEKAIESNTEIKCS